MMKHTISHKKRYIYKLFLSFVYLLGCIGQSIVLQAHGAHGHYHDHHNQHDFISSKNNNNSKNIYTSIAQENLKALTDIEYHKDHEQDDTLFGDDEHNGGQILRDTLNRQLHPAAHLKRRAIFKLLAHKKGQDIDTNNSVLDDTTWRDLEMVCGAESNPYRYIAHRVDRTSTEIGRVLLYGKIVQPTANIQQLQEQQSIVKKLLEDDELFTTLDTKLRNLELAENAILSFWGEDEFKRYLRHVAVEIPGQESYKNMRALSEYCNRTPWALEMGEKVHLLQDVIKGTVYATACIALPLYALSLYSNCDTISNGIESMNNKIGITPKGIALSSVPGICAYLGNMVIENKWSLGILSIVSGLAAGAKSYTMSQHIPAEIALYSCLQEKLMYVRQYIESLVTLSDISQKSQDISRAIPSLKALAGYTQRVDQSEVSHKISQLITLLKSSTFTGEPTYFSYVGRVLAAYRLMDELKEHLIEPMIALGELDVVMSIARLMREQEACNNNNQDIKNRYSFAQYLENQSTPSVNLVGFWNPLLDQQEAIPNSIKLGSLYSQPQNMIITGPNAGGKSTAMKSIVLSIILAQSLGIAPAQELVFTPFDAIMTYLNITDDTGDKKSLFESGVLRARTLLNSVDQHAKNGKYVLVGIDEIFNGTSYKEGQAAAYSIIKSFGSHANVMSVINTHYKLIPSLEKTGNFVNYKVTVNYDDAGKIQYTYTLEPGFSDQIITFDVLQEKGFTDEFLIEAQAIAQNS